MEGVLQMTGIEFFCCIFFKNTIQKNLSLTMMTPIQTKKVCQLTISFLSLAFTKYSIISLSNK